MLVGWSVVGCNGAEGVYGPESETAAALSARPGPVAVLHFDGDTRDASKNGHDALVYGDPQFVDGSADGALYFDGEDDYLEVPFARDLQPARFTIELRFRSSDVLGNGFGFVPLVVKLPEDGNFWSAADGYDLWYQDSGTGGRLGGGMGTEQGRWRVAPSVYREVTPDAFHYLVETFDGSRVELYVDGERVDTVFHPGHPAYLGGSIWIGGNVRHSYYGAERFYFHGTIDEFAIYNYPFSADEVSRRAEGRGPADPAPGP